MEQHYFKDGVQYGAKIYDDDRSTTPLGRFVAKLDLDNLKQVPHKVVYFESLAGADRVLHELSNNNVWYRKMTSELVFTYPGILSTADRIISKLVNSNKYLGVHVRLSDSYFRGEHDNTVHSIITSIESLSNLQTFTARPFEVVKPTGEEYAEKCANKMIYMATEMKQSRTVEVFRELYERFDCVRTLSDFEDELSNLDFIRNRDFDEIPMKSFLIPMIDMVVAARGRAFVGTPASSFSEHARRLHGVFWKWDLEKNINVTDNDNDNDNHATTKDAASLMDDDQLWAYASTLSSTKPAGESATPSEVSSNTETALI